MDLQLIETDREVRAALEELLHVEGGFQLQRVEGRHGRYRRCHGEHCQASTRQGYDRTSERPSGTLAILA